jgi:prevent-host-death family protein
LVAFFRKFCLTGISSPLRRATPVETFQNATSSVLCSNRAPCYKGAIRAMERAVQLTISAAKFRFSDMIATAERGEEVVITRRDVPVIRLAPIFAPLPIRLGLLEGVVSKDSIPAFF